MIESIPNYDSWKLATPDYEDDPCMECDKQESCEFNHEPDMCGIEDEWMIEDE